MKKTALIFWIYFLSTFFTFLKAQVFEQIDTLNLPLLKSSTIVWADLDNNGFQDAIIRGKSMDGIDTIFHLTNSKDAFQFLPSSLPALSNMEIELADFNHDSYLDVLLTGTDSDGEFIVEVWENRNAFAFDKAPLLMDGWQSGRGIWADLDRNGSYDIVFSGKDSNGNNRLLFYKSTNGSFDTSQFELLALSEAELAQLDADRDGLIDIVISGLTSEGLLETILLHNQGDFAFDTVDISTTLAASELNIGDLNHDGYSDITISGMDDQGNATTQLFFNKRYGNFEFYETLNNWQAEKLLVADLDKNGLADIFFAGVDGNGEATTAIYQYDSLADRPTYIVLDTLLPLVSTASLSDVDNDGDLDIITLGEDELQTGVFINNFEGENLMPSTPTNPFAIAIHGQTMFTWVGSIDDYTSSTALTYEVFAGNREFAVDHVSPYFITQDGSRKMSQHGTSWQTSFYSLNKLLSGEIFWGVQPIDNSLANNASNICNGNVLYDCVDITLKDTLLCSGSMLELVDPVEDEQAIWFSVKQGYLGTFDTLNIELTENDTIFYVVPNDLDCSLATSWNVKVLPTLDDFSLGNDTTLCVGEPLILDISNQSWASITWSSAKQGVLGNERSLTLEIVEEDTISVIAINQAGCQYEDEILIKVFETTAFASEDVTINQGESVQIGAFNAITYPWSPDVAIDDSTLSNPTVSPPSNTTYLVEMLDSVGCTVVDTVIVTVEKPVSSAKLFIPNLFTPNNDGNNDAFKLYGLQEVSTISFHIFDAQGTMVYTSEDINSLESTGWDGSKGGRVLKNGTYFWRIDGQYQNGDPIDFNGKQQGFLTLLR